MYDLVHVAIWQIEKVFSWPSSSSLVMMFVFVTNARPPPLRPCLFEGNSWN